MEVKNPTEYDTELYSTDFDTKYLVDEEYLNSYEILNEQEQVYEHVRKPGEDIWPEIKKAVEKKRMVLKL